MPSLIGNNFIGSARSSAGTTQIEATNATTGEALPGMFTQATIEEIDAACSLAADAFPAYSQTTTVQRAAFLRQIADNLEQLGDELVQRTMAETGLPEGRIVGERGRTMGQLRLFAGLIEEGTYLNARIDLGQPDRTPMPKPDVRCLNVALGPVAVFGASNFPLAFSTAGGDTASALAAGCSVVVKAHPAHPGCAELVAGAILAAVETTGMPNGTFSMIQGADVATGQALVMHPAIKAVGFTGSIPAGRAIYNAAATRPEPIPVFAEMGSSNPVFVLPGALAARAESIAQGLVGSVCLGAGQFCTNPGMTVLIESDEANAFINQTADLLGSSPAGTTVHASIKAGYDREVAEKLSVPHVELVAKSTAETDNPATAVQPQLFRTTAENYATQETLKSETFGPCTMAVTCKGKAQLLALAENLEGHLTATIFGEESDFAEYADLVQVLQNKVGRVIANQYPTGVEVCTSMQHGGPYPASSDSRTTSVGTAAIDRFVRPVAYQNFPQSLLPAAIGNDNVLGIWRTVDGTLSKESV